MTTPVGGDVFVGRAAELAVLRRELEHARAGRPRTVLVSGPAGAGKTALVDRLAGAAPGVRTLWVGGEPAETRVPYAIADQLFRLAGAPEPDLLATGPALAGTGHVEVGLRLLDRLSEPAQEAPLLLVLDDAPWMDAPSLRAVLFAQRRLVADDVLVVLTARTDGLHELPGGFVRQAARAGAEIALQPLAATDLQELASGLGVGLPLPAAERLAAHTEGSPLHARALLAEVPAAAWRGVEPLPAPRSYAEIVSARLASVSVPASELAAAVAVLGHAAPVPEAAELAEVTAPLDALDELVAAALVRSDGRAAAFVHPLTAAAVYERVPPARRARLHLRAAAAAERRGDVDTALEHRQRAAAGADDELADALAARAAEQEARGAWMSAAANVASAAELTADGDRRTARLLAATDLYTIAGDVHHARAAADALEPGTTGLLHDAVLGQLLTYELRPDAAHALLDRAWHACDPEAQPQLAARIARSTVLYHLVRLQAAAALMWADRALDSSAPDDPGRAFARWSRGIALTALGEGARAEAELTEALDGAPDGAALALRIGRGWVRLARDDFAGARADLTATASAAREARSLEIGALALAHLARAEYASGRWDAALLAANRAQALLADVDAVPAVPFVRWAAALVPSARGDTETLDALLAGFADTPPVLENLVAGTALARAHAHASRGAHGEVLTALEPLVRMEHRDVVDAPGFLPWQHLHAGALVALGRADEAGAFLAPHEDRAREHGPPSAVARFQRVRGRIAAAHGEAGAAVAAYEAAIAGSGAAGIPFERAMAELALGELLRRQGSRRAAAARLEAALATFTDLGARPSAERARRELAACGLTPVKRRGADRDRLTPQEQAVRRLVATGMTNREVAAELLVSTKTVEVHLTRVFRKLGVASRAELVGLGVPAG